MGLETGTYINSLNASNPDGATDQKSEGDDHLRLIKSTIKNTFPNITGAMNATQGELNILASAGKTAFSSTDNVIDSHPAGTLQLFQQTSAPTGWTKQSTHNDKALRVVSGTASSGGTDAFSTHFGTSKSTAGHALALSEIPSHSHDLAVYTLGTGSQFTSTLNAANTPTNVATSAEGGGGSHSHTLNNFNIQYVDVIIASKN